MKPRLLCMLLAATAWAGPVRINGVPSIDAKGKTASAEARWLSSPMAGYYVRAAPLEVRAILGAPGATHYSEPFEIPEGVVDVLAAPGQQWLLGLRDGRPPVAWTPETGAVFDLLLPPGATEGIAFSNSGNTAVFYSRAEGRAILYTALAGIPQIVTALDASVWPPDLEKLAVSERGTMVAGLTGSGEVLVLARDSQAMRRLLLDSSPSFDLAFRGESESLVLVDRQSRLLVIDDPMQGTAAREITTLTPALSSGPVRLTMGVRNSIVVTDGAMGRIEQIDPETAEIRALVVEPFTAATPLRWRGMLMLSAPGAASRMVAGDGQADVFYVPVMKENEQ
jgi:hypothetical protein